MERLIEMVCVLAVLYAGYALGMKRWNYTSQADREKRRTQLKTLGLSNTFYFIHAGTLFFLILCSGGTFVFYWIYQQWKAILQGFKRLDGTPLPKGPFIRTLGCFVTFYSLGSIINRTCEYMRKPVSWSPVWWGTLWLGGLFTLLLCDDISLRLFGAFLFCLAPTIYQRRLNLLPKKPLPITPKPKELIAAAFGLTLFLGLCITVRMITIHS